MKTLQEILDDFGKNETATANLLLLERYRERNLVYEFNRNGDLIKTWKSTRDLRINGGFEIKKTQRGCSIKRDGRIFSMDPSFSKIKDKVEEDFDKICSKQSMSVCQFKSDGTLVGTYKTLRIASKGCNINPASISRNIRNPYTLKGEKRTLKGFYFRHEKSL